MTKAQKVTFFERGARATERVYDSLPKDIYPCPLCGRMFTRSDCGARAVKGFGWAHPVPNLQRLQ